LSNDDVSERRSKGTSSLDLPSAIFTKAHVAAVGIGCDDGLCCSHEGLTSFHAIHTAVADAE
jgi:hypothetical protein